MNAFIQGLPVSQQHICNLLYQVLTKYPDSQYFAICRKRPSFTPRDVDTGEIFTEFTWIQGYAKSAKALVQRAILVSEGYQCYSVTPYGKQVLGLKGN